MGVHGEIGWSARHSVGNLRHVFPTGSKKSPLLGIEQKLSEHMVLFLLIQSWVRSLKSMKSKMPFLNSSYWIVASSYANFLASGR